MNLFHEAKKVLDKDGKVNPLGPYGKQKLTGREVSAYFRRNKVADGDIKKAVEVALDLQGAMSVASKEIAKFYGNKILKSKEVQNALKYANEESILHDIRDDLNEGSFYGRDDLVKQFATPKNKRHLYIKLRKTDSKGTHGVSMAKKGNEDKIKKYKADGYKEVPIESVDENYRQLAQKGMGAEDKKSIKVGREVDYYEPKQGNKRQGKITKMTAKGYTVQDDQDKKSHTFVFHDRMKAKKLLAASNEFDKNPLKGFPYNEELQKNIQEEVRSVLGEAPYDKADVKKVQGLEKKLRNMLKEVEKVMRGSGLSAPAFANVRSGISKGLTSIEKFYKVANKNVKESINETKKQEVDAMKKISKDMQSVLKAYQKVSTMGDKTLKDTKHNASYKKVLDARNAILTMIGTLNTQMLLTREETNLWAKLMTEEMITYRVKKMQKPELDKFQKSAKMMRLKLNLDQGKDDTVLVVSGSKKKLRDFDSVVRGKSSYGDPSTIKHFDEK